MGLRKGQPIGNQINLFLFYFRHEKTQKIIKDATFYNKIYFIFDLIFEDWMMLDKLCDLCLRAVLIVNLVYQQGFAAFLRP